MSGSNNTGKQPEGKKEKIEDEETERAKRREKTDKKKQEERDQYRRKKQETQATEADDISTISQSQIQGKQQEDKLQAERQATKWEKEEAKYDEGKRKRNESNKNKQLRKPYEMPIWLRVGNITMGILFVVLSIIAFQNRTAAVQTAIYVLAAIIFLSGFTRFINSFYDKEISGTKRLIRFSISLVLILIALFIYIFPTVGETVLLAVLAIAIIVQGVGRIFMGTRHEALPRWLKVSQITMGGISLILGTSAIIPIVFAITLPISIIVLLVIGFFVSGLSRISFGILGLKPKKQIV